MYAIISYENDFGVTPILSDGKFLKTFDTLEQADKFANDMVADKDNDYLKVISLSSVHE